MKPNCAQINSYKLFQKDVKIAKKRKRQTSGGGEVRAEEEVEDAWSAPPSDPSGTLCLSIDLPQTPPTLPQISESWCDLPNIACSKFDKGRCFADPYLLPPVLFQVWCALSQPKLPIGEWRMGATVIGWCAYRIRPIVICGLLL